MDEEPVGDMAKWIASFDSARQIGLNMPYPKFLSGINVNSIEE